MLLSDTLFQLLTLYVEMLCLGDVGSPVGEGYDLVIAHFWILMPVQVAFPTSSTFTTGAIGVLLRFRTSWPLLPQPATNTSISGSTRLIAFTGDIREEKELSAARDTRLEQEVILPKFPCDVGVFEILALGKGTGFSAAEGSAPWAVPA